MSGFGGGFGGSPPPGGFGGGFGQPAPPAAPPMSFGSSPTITAAPPGGGGFPNSPFGSGGGGGFGNTNAAAVSTSFAAPASFGGGGPGGFGNNNNNIMGSAFGQAPAAGGGFGAPSGGFGQPTGFGNGNGGGSGGFGSSFGSAPAPQQQQMMDVPNPFGSAPPSGAPSVSFGMSSNVAMHTGGPPTPSGGMAFAAPASTSSPFGNSNAPAPAFSSAGPSFGQAPTAASSSGPFGSAPPSGGGMTFAAPAAAVHHQRSSSVDMGGSESPTPMSAFGGTFHPPSNANMDGTNLGSLTPIPEDNTMGDHFAGGASNMPTAQPVADAEQEKLAKLKAKLEAKKKKLEKLAEQKQRKKNQEADDGDSKQTPKRNSNNRSRSNSPLLSPEQQARAERNAARFSQSTNTATQAHMPSELRGRQNDAPRPTVTSAVGGDANREDLANAKSLVGTCHHMCPDEELLRRERENDIQLLEIPDPGGIHPPNWTLRNTAVKRFRRSAADFKLDVPEWVRPPDVLEEVCSYLEEWVMERDRQGPDRRCPQNGTPNSMDVYQFIWDRTRMIRKDFILQNYVGTGGACDARAVRCHERIARWHAMCEHQLSHISDFVVMQSQQNIQELGQAMKTLNQYYDDSMGRAIVEVPDEEGRETRKNFSNFSHGCASDACQGVNPVDYDGSPLNNTSDVSKLPSQRLIGKGMVNSPTRGTAEPEMRGLYIILTMNNDGGMEVMSYSAALYRERPEIYNSKPVQLALDIFKAKKDYNYVRFFRILKDSNTPYLFSCLMFKHVESMRKAAFRIMSKTYGAKKDGKPIYDHYPINRLAHMLCFEDLDEARAACKHYNITVKEVKARDKNTGQIGLTECVFWRHSDFKEARDPVKGHVLPLRPKKMLRHIERKLNGATRLGVCRGEVSGKGASLSQLPEARTPLVAPPAAPDLPLINPVQVALPDASPIDDSPSPAPPSDGTQQDLLLEQQQQQKKKEEEAKAREKEKQRLLREEYERKKAEKLRLKMEERKRREQKRLQEEELKRQQAETLKEEERKRKEEEKRLWEQKQREDRERAEQAAKKVARLKEEERLRKLEDEARLKAEAEAREKERLELLRREEERRQREIEAERERQRQAELERKRQEEERRRLETLRAQEEERKRKEALARKAAQELDERVDKARKLLLLRRWRQQLPRQFLSQAKTEQTLRGIDPTFCLSSPISGDLLDREIAAARSASHARTASEIIDWRKILNRILSKEVIPLDVASMMLRVLCQDDELMEHVQSKRYRIKESNSVTATFLLKVAVILPEPDGLEEESIYEAIHTWLIRFLEYDKTDIVQQVDLTGTLTAEVRVRFVKADSWSGPVSCDAALLVIPPPFCSGDTQARKVDAISAAFNCVEEGTPRAAFVLGESFDSDYYTSVNQFLAACIPTDTEEFPVVFPNAVSEAALEGSLLSSLRSLVSAYTAEFPPLVEQVSVLKMACKCISDTLWRNPGTDSLQTAVAALSEFNKELDQQGQLVAESWSIWPVDDFADERGLVKNYFGGGLHLPTSWSSPVFQDGAKSKIVELQESMQGSVPQAVSHLLAKAPYVIQEECKEMLERRQYRKCLQRALEFAGLDDETMIYLPKGTADSIVAKSIERVLGDVDQFASGLLLNEDNEESADSEATGEPVTTVLDLVDMSGDVEAIDDAEVFKKARDIFEISRNSFSPIPPGAMTTPAPGTRSPPPGTVSPPPGVSSAKRSWIGMATGGDDDGNDGDTSPMRSPVPGSSTKRPRASYGTRTTRSREEIESSAFTKKLQALLNGEATVDMDVGKTTLARLVRDTPLLDGGAEESKLDLE